VKKIKASDVAVIIANRAPEDRAIERAKKRGCFIIHRIDEDLSQSPGENPWIEKHQRIQALNHFADVTVFQSEFVSGTATPVLKPLRSVVIRNGADPTVYYSTAEAGSQIGHVTWGLAEKKRLDLLRRAIVEHPDESFLLIGRQAESGLDFDLPNVEMTGPYDRENMPDQFRKMKLLYFPSQNDPCSNTVIESILSGVPVCYHNSGGHPELVRDCGEPLSRFGHMLQHVGAYRDRCSGREDLYLDGVMRRYLDLYEKRDD
jgi:glycosyltransferase involved in cell wall biosynthesis